MKVKFKPHGLKAIQALFRTQRISIIHTPTQQGLINWKTMQPINPGAATVDALMYAPLRGWTLFPIALCRDQMGRRYIQFETVKVPDIYSSSQLGGIDERYLIEQPDGRKVSVIDFHVERFRASCNPGTWLIWPGCWCRTWSTLMSATWTLCWMRWGRGERRRRLDCSPPQRKGIPNSSRAGHGD